MRAAHHVSQFVLAIVSQPRTRFELRPPLAKKVSSFPRALNRRPRPSTRPRALVHVDIPIVCPLAAVRACFRHSETRSHQSGRGRLGRFNGDERGANLCASGATKNRRVKAMGPDSSLHFLGFGLPDPCFE